MTSEVDERKTQLLTMLDDSRARHQADLESVDPERVIYDDSGWRVKDLIAHCAAWEAEVVNALDAYAQGEEYTIHGYTTDHAFNLVIWERTRDMPIEDIRAQWDTTRTRFRMAVRAIPPERFDGQIMCPWKKLSGIDGIVRDMVNHEAEHVHDILAKVD